MGKRILALLLAMSVIFSSASCGIYNSSHGKKVISADAPWYNSEFIDVDLGVDTGRPIDELWQQYAGSDDKNVVIFTDGYYKQDESKPEQDLKNSTISVLVVIDRSTKTTVKTIDLVSPVARVNTAGVVPNTAAVAPMPRAATARPMTTINLFFISKLLFCFSIDDYVY